MIFSSYEKGNKVDYMWKMYPIGVIIVVVEIVIIETATEISVGINIWYEVNLLFITSNVVIITNNQ